MSVAACRCRGEAEGAGWARQVAGGRRQLERASHTAAATCEFWSEAQPAGSFIFVLLGRMQGKGLHIIMCGCYCDCSGQSLGDSCISGKACILRCMLSMQHKMQAQHAAQDAWLTGNVTVAALHASVAAVLTLAAAQPTTKCYHSTHTAMLTPGMGLSLHRVS